MVWADPPNVEHLKKFIDGASWSFAVQQGTQVKDAGIARDAGQRHFGVHMNFLLRRYSGPPGEPAAPPPQKGGAAPQPGKKR